MKPPKKIFIQNDGLLFNGALSGPAYVTRPKQENSTEYVKKGEELRGLLRYIKRWQSNELDRNALTVLGIMEREINRRLK